jgi:hypothetical protein
MNQDMLSLYVFMFICMFPVAIMVSISCNNIYQHHKNKYNTVYNNGIINNINNTIIDEDPINY